MSGGLVSRLRNAVSGGTSRSDQRAPNVDVDEAFEAISNERRRWLIQAIAALGPDGQEEIGVLSDQLAAYENDIPAHQVSSRQRKSAYVTIYQCHLPKLDEAGLVEWDSDAGVVRPTPATDELADHIRSLETALRGETHG